MDPSNTRIRWQPRFGRLAILFVAGTVLHTGPARAQNCTDLLPLFREGRSTVEIARITGLSANTVAACRVQLSRPTQEGPAGPPPIGAAGRSPHGAAGPPPHGAAGPPPHGAAGAPPISRQPPLLP